MKEKIKEILDKTLQISLESIDEFDGTEERIITGKQQASAEIEKLFPVWIPISERLPEKLEGKTCSKQVLIVGLLDNNEYCYETARYFNCEDDGKQWGYWTAAHIIPLAWQEINTPKEILKG
ncbi:MAG: hypothetical protein ACM34K_13255 [Bacillota bacterium]